MGVYLLLLEDNLEFLEVILEWVYEILLYLNKYKVLGFDGLFNWCLKEYVELLYLLIVDIFNLLYKE